MIESRSEKRLADYNTQIGNIQQRLDRGTRPVKKHRRGEARPEGEAAQVPLTGKKTERLIWNKDTLEELRTMPDVPRRARIPRPQPF